MAGYGWQDVTPRERTVLAAVERRLTNAEIAAELCVSVRTVESHIAALRRKLDVRSRAALVSAAQARRRTAVHLPQNSFVGRAADLDGVRTLLDRERWVTVVGPAGCGKTRLALELAVSGDRVPVVVELEGARPGDVLTLVARGLGLPADGGAATLAGCGVAARARPCLLVVDNCDRVADAVCPVVSALLVLAPALAVLATSRSPLGASDEAVHELRPLPTGGGAEPSAPVPPAVELFLDRARSVAPGRVTPGDADLAARVCRRLDGLPLAIELAAARVRHLPLAELAVLLDAGFGALERAGPVQRHRTLQAAFDWTWDLLEDRERLVLGQLSALPGPFDLPAADALLGAGTGPVVLRLADRSLVSPVPDPHGPRRFRLLAALRAFVLDRTDPDVVRTVRRAHARWTAAAATVLAERARTDDGPAAADAAARLQPDADAALLWALTEQDDAALPLARALAVLVEQYGSRVDSLEALTRAAQAPHVRDAADPEDLLLIGLAPGYGAG